MTGNSRRRRRSSTKAAERPATRRPMRSVGISWVGSDPPPAIERPVTSLISILSGNVRRSIAASRFARFLTSATGSVSARRTRMSARASAGRRYFTIVASSAANVSLSIRSARFSGFFRIVSIKARLPRMSPAWGPPSSLSPLKVTTSAPAARQSRTVGSRSRP